MYEMIQRLVVGLKCEEEEARFVGGGVGGGGGVDVCRGAQFFAPRETKEAVARLSCSAIITPQTISISWGGFAWGSGGVGKGGRQQQSTSLIVRATHCLEQPTALPRSAQGRARVVRRACAPTTTIEAPLPCVFTFSLNLSGTHTTLIAEEKALHTDNRTPDQASLL